MIATIVGLSAQSFIPRTENSLFRSALPSGRAAKLMNFRHFSDPLVDEQLKFPVIFPVSREFATGFGREQRGLRQTS